MDPHSRAPKKNTSHGNEVLRKILHISYKDLVANEEVRARIQQAIGPHEDLLTILKETQTEVVWSCFPFIRSGQNHLARHSERGKKTRRTKEDNREWTGLEFGKSQRAVENREKWRKLVAKSSVVPQRPSRVMGLMMMMMQCS